MCGHRTAVCFSCGNASAELKAVGVDVIDVSPRGDLLPLRWFAPHEIASVFPGAFDATSGHLPIECMAMVADEFKRYLREVPPRLYVPSGSGETIVALKMAFPDIWMCAVYDIDDATEYSEFAPLNAVVRAIADDIVHGVPAA